ncbi:MAG: C40 family peptidase [Paramuribaculum sp.]|nr:C40 family peptidase [Paramuribaculum sp.]
MIILKWAAAALATVAIAFPTDAERTKVVAPMQPEEADADFAHLDIDDDYVPSLAELLGGPVDNLGNLFGTTGIENDIVDYAKTFIGKRYRRGAKGPSAFDCSGFTSYVFSNFDMSLASSSRAQALQGEKISVTDARPGDLVFFSGRRAGSTVGHVGIVVSADPVNGTVKFIHAATSRGVRIDSYPDGGYYSRRFHSIRRVIES